MPLRVNTTTNVPPAPTPINTIYFEDSYRIAAAKHGIEYGARVSPNTDPVDAPLGHSFTVTEDWVTGTMDVTDAEKPVSIRFLPRTTASAVLFKRVRNVVTPIYVGSLRTEPFPPGSYNLTPTGMACLFFMPQDAPTAFNMNDVPTTTFLFQTNGQPTSTIIYNEKGAWELDNGSLAKL